MARLGNPSAMSVRTSFSRGVSRSSWASIDLRLVSRVAIVRGVISILPRATSRIAATTSAAAHLHVGLVVDQGGEAFRDDAVIFHDQDSSRMVVTVDGRRARGRGWLLGQSHIWKTAVHSRVLR